MRDSLVRHESRESSRMKNAASGWGRWGLDSICVTVWLIVRILFELLAGCLGSPLDDCWEIGAEFGSGDLVLWIGLEVVVHGTG